MLEIRDVQYFPDGRSVVDTVGGRRFKVLSRGTREGYNTAKVEFLKDRIEEDEQQLQGTWLCLVLASTHSSLDLIHSTNQWQERTALFCMKPGVNDDQ